MEMTRSNLKKALGNSKTDAEIEKMVQEVNGRLFEIVVEFARIPKLLKDPERWIPRGNPEIIWDGLKKGKGVILLVSHYGSWDYLAIGGGLEGYPIHVVGKPNSNPFIQAYIEKIRGKTGIKTIEKIGAVKDVSELLKQNQAVGLLIDQRVKGGEPVEFLGQTAYFANIAALLAVRYGAPVIPCFVFRRPGPQYFVTATPPMEIKEGKDLRETLQINTQLFAKRIEEEILKTPTEWVLWRHNIWKE
jgi:KDO2-lipid IV(A) lauroyltransferase